MKKPKALKKSPYRIVRLGSAHARLWVSAALGAVAGYLLPVQIDAVGRLLLGWDIGVFIYLVRTTIVVHQCSSGVEIAQKANRQDEGAAAVMLLTVLAAAISFGAIFAELLATKDSNSAWPQVLAVVTVVLSWTFTHAIFALHYAYEFYDEHGTAGGLDFPGRERPDYWDFVYFSFVIGMTFQVSDVAVESKSIRRMVVAHGVLSFLFNTTIIALTVNMAANAVK